jgi:serine/threonine protein kinase
MSLISQKIINYRITEKIGEGGMGSVYLATHELLKTKAAIKVLHPAMGADEQLKSRFLTEASTLSAMNHPYIVRVLDFTENEHGLFIIMEYVSGLPLNELIAKEGAIPEERAFRIFDKVLNGLQYAHSRKPAIVHRDIKPSNIIVNEEDDPKIIDFGIVKIMDKDAASHTMAGTKVGTPVYMSPEQIYGQELDNRSDIYSLGVTLFTMLAGQSPYANSVSEFEIQEKIIRAPLPRLKELNPATSDKGQAIIDKATAKAREDRFSSCDEFRNALHQNFETSANNTTTPSPANVPVGEATTVLPSSPFSTPPTAMVSNTTDANTSSSTNTHPPKPVAAGEATTVLPTVPQPSAPSVSNNQPAVSAPVSHQPHSVPPVAKKSSKKNLIILFSIIGVVIIAAVFFLTRGSRTKYTYTPPTNYNSKRSPQNDYQNQQYKSQQSNTQNTLTDEYLGNLVNTYLAAEYYYGMQHLYAPILTRFYDETYVSKRRIKEIYDYTWSIRSNIVCTVKAMDRYPDGEDVKVITTYDYSFYDLNAAKYQSFVDQKLTFVINNAGKIKAIH